MTPEQLTEVNALLPEGWKVALGGILTVEPKKGVHPVVCLVEGSDTTTVIVDFDRMKLMTSG